MLLKVESPADMLSRKEAFRYLNSIGCPIALRTLDNMAARKSVTRGPPFFRFTWNTVRYKRSDLDIWAKANVRRVE